MLSSMALGIVGLAYSLVVACLYFWKKRANKEGDLKTFFFRLLVIFLVGLGFMELGCIASIYYIEESHPVLNEFFCRLHILADITFIILFLVYIYISTKSGEKDENYIKRKRFLSIFLTIMVVIIYLISCCFDVTYHAIINNDYLIIAGYAMYPVYILSAISLLCLVILLLRYRKRIDKSFSIPIISFCILYTILAVIQFLGWPYKINFIVYTLVVGIVAMFITIESQDIKLLAEAEQGRKDAETANKAKTEFLSNISHEIRTPMNTILGFSQTLLEEKNLSEKTVKRDAESIKAASAKLLELINNILDISRIESGKETIEEKDYKLEDLLFEVNSIISSKINKEAIDFKIGVDGNIPTKYIGDSAKIYKVLVSVLLNAINKTNYGSVNLDVGGAYVGESFKLSFVVSNSGHEMTEAEFEQTFEDFAEVNENNTTVDSVKLGLIIAKRLIQMMGGNIDFKNEKGRGTRYIISVDQKVSDDMKLGDIFVKEDLQEELSHTDFTGKTVLVVDDNKLNIELATRMLKQFNMTVTSADNGKKCIDLVKDNMYDIIFLDHMMPELDGVATVHSLRDSGCDVPIIALTANSYTGSKEMYIKEGFTDFLSKPFKLKDLGKMLAKYIGK